MDKPHIKDKNPALPLEMETPKLDLSTEGNNDSQANSAPDLKAKPSAGESQAQGTVTEDNLRIERPKHTGQSLNEEALKLLDQYSAKAKDDCLQLIQSIAKNKVDEDAVLDGRVEALDTLTGDQKQKVSELAQAINTDLGEMEKIVAASAPPQTQFPNEKDFWTKYWGQTKNNAGAAYMNAGDIQVDAANSANINKLKEDAVSAYQAVNEAQGGISHLLTASDKNWPELWRQLANKDVISPLSKLNEATLDLTNAYQNLEQASHIDPSVYRTGLTIMRMGAMGGGYGAAAGLALGALATGFSALRASHRNNKVGNESLVQIKSCVQTFHDADSECRDYLNKVSPESDPQTVEQMQRLEGELSQVMPELDNLKDMASRKKHPSWKQMDQSLDNVQADERIKDIGASSRYMLDRYQNDATGM